MKINPPDGKERDMMDGIYAKDEVISDIKQATEIIEAARLDKIIKISSNCIVSQAPFDYLHRIYNNLGIIYIDAHPDVSTVQDGYPNAHAMVLGSLMGHSDDSLSDLLKNDNFKANEILYIGLQELHDYQEDFLRKEKIAYAVQSENIVSNDEIKKFTSSFDHMLVHLDIDVLDADLFHSTYFANKDLVGDDSSSGKRTIEQLSCVLKSISVHTDIVGFTIAEYLPFDEHKLHKMFADIDIFYNK